VSLVSVVNAVCSLSAELMVFEQWHPSLGMAALSLSSLSQVRVSTGQVQKAKDQFVSLFQLSAPDPLCFRKWRLCAVHIRRQGDWEGERGTSLGVFHLKGCIYDHSSRRHC